MIGNNLVGTNGEITSVEQKLCHAWDLSAGKWQSCYQNSSLLTFRPGILALALWYFSGRWPSYLPVSWQGLAIDDEEPQEGQEKEVLKG